MKIGTIIYQTQPRLFSKDKQVPCEVVATFNTEKKRYAVVKLLEDDDNKLIVLSYVESPNGSITYTFATYLTEL